MSSNVISAREQRPATKPKQATRKPPKPWLTRARLRSLLPVWSPGRRAACRHGSLGNGMEWNGGSRALGIPKAVLGCIEIRKRGHHWRGSRSESASWLMLGQHRAGFWQWFVADGECATSWCKIAGRTVSEYCQHIAGTCFFHRNSWE